TITYVLAGTVNHGDSLGNKGALGAGDVQWMTAGSGILHQEMPRGDPRGRMHGFQLWANLPSSLKMTRPRYQDISAAAIPEVTDDDGTRVRVICGSFWGKAGPVEGVAADPRYLDVWVPPGQRKSLPVETSGHAFAYVFEGGGTFRDASEPGAVRTERVGPVVTGAGGGGGGGGPAGEVENRSLVLFDSGDAVTVQAGTLERQGPAIHRPAQAVRRDRRSGGGVRRPAGRARRSARWDRGGDGACGGRALRAAGVSAHDHHRRGARVGTVLGTVRLRRAHSPGDRPNGGPGG